MIGVVYGYYVKHGGIGRYISNLLDNIDNKENITLLTMEQTLPIPDKIKLRKISCERDNGFLNRDENISFSKEIEKISGEFNLINSHGVYDFIPDIYTAHICFREYSRRLENYFGKKVITPELINMENLEEKLLSSKNFKALSGVSKMVADNFSNIYGIDPKNVKILRGASRFKKKCLKKGTLSSLSVGLIGDNLLQKGFTFCNSMLNEAVRRGLPVSLENIGGNETIQEYLSKYARYPFKIRLKGDLEEKDYESFDALAVLSVYETYSLSTLEAMSLGIPVISSDLNGVFYDAEDKTLARVGDISNSKEAADMLEKVFLDQKFRDEVVSSGYEITCHNWKNLAKDFNEIYREGYENG